MIDAPPPSRQAAWLCDGWRLAKEGGVRATTAFKRLLRLPGASIIEVAFAPEGSS